MSQIDLHMHTFYSDGMFSPAEVIEGASRKGIRSLAITDHANTRGSREAVPLARAAGIELIPGIEITCRWPRGELPPEYADVDVLGYFIDLEDRELLAFEEVLLFELHQRVAHLCDRMTRAGYPLSMQDVFNESQNYGGGGPMIDAVLRKGYAAASKEANELVDTFWYTDRTTPFTIKSVIEQIHLAGGVAVLAHPTGVHPRGDVLEAGKLHELVDAGLDGLEVYHHRLNESDRQHFLKLAKEFSLAVTGGSDMHGGSHGLDRLGSQPVTEEMLEALRQRKPG
jgi:3',5'-nucleoside bisphosphate phosphatase